MLNHETTLIKKIFFSDKMLNYAQYHLPECNGQHSSFYTLRRVHLDRFVSKLLTLYKVFYDTCQYCFESNYKILFYYVSLQCQKVHGNVVAVSSLTLSTVNLIFYPC